MAITNSTQNVLMYGFNGTNPDRVEINGSGHMKCNVENSLTIATMPSTDISGQYVNVSNFPATQTVDGTVDVGNFPATQDVSGSVSVSNNTDPATATLQTAGNADISDIKTNTTQEAGAYSFSKALPVILTTYDGGSSLNVVGSQSGSNMKVYIDDANPDFVANSGMATSTKQDAQTALLTSIDGNITACNTGAVVVSSSALPSGASTATLQTAGNASLSAIEASHYAEGDSFGVSDTGVMMMGRNGSNTAKPIHITANGDVEVEIADFVKGQDTSNNSFPVVLASDAVVSVVQADVIAQGSENNIENNASIVAGALSSLSADITNMKTANILYEDSATSSFDGIDIEVSGNNGTNYHVVSLLYPQTSGSIRFAYLTIDVGGLTNMRIRNNSSTDTYTNVECSVYGSA